MARFLTSLRPLLTLVSAPFGAPPRRAPPVLTEAQWRTCPDLVVMMQFTEGRAAGHRKMRLFAAACCRRVLDLLPDERSRAAVDAFDRFTEGLAGAEEVQAAMRRAWEVGENAASYLASEEPFLVAFRASVDRARAADPDGPAVCEPERAAQRDLLRDLCNPFHAGLVDAALLSWNGGTVPRLAGAIYEERRFGDLPILADALEEAGCTDHDLLRHCRSGGEHVRGCWAVDLLLGRD